MSIVCVCVTAHVYSSTANNFYVCYGFFHYHVLLHMCKYVPGDSVNKHA